MLPITHNNISTESDYFIISRGEARKLAEERWPEIKRITGKNDLKELDKFIASLKDVTDYSGVLHTNTFKVSHPILLVGLGFFGPKEKNLAFYNTTIEIELLHQKSRKDSRLLSKTFFSQRIDNQSIFRIIFDQPVMIQANLFYNVRFQLDGPKTRFLDSGQLINRHCSFLNNKRVEFDFLRGSLQMPEMLYRVL